MGVDHGRIIAVKLTRAVAVTLCLVQLGVLCGACSASHKAAPRTPGRSASTGSAAGTLVVLASTQLKPAFEQLDTQFAAANPGVAVTATYQGSQALVTEVQAGTQGDLFASDADPMAALAQRDFVLAVLIARYSAAPTVRRCSSVLSPIWSGSLTIVMVGSGPAAWACPVNRSGNATSSGEED